MTVVGWTLGGFMRTLRTLTGFSIGEASYRVGVNSAHLSRVESDKRGVSEEVVAKLGELYGGYSRLGPDHVSQWVVETHRIIRHHTGSPPNWNTAVEETFRHSQDLFWVVGATPQGQRDLLELAEIYWVQGARSASLMPFEGSEWVAYCVMMALRDPLLFSPEWPTEKRQHFERLYRGVADRIQLEKEWAEAYKAGSPKHTTSGVPITPQPNDVISLLQTAFQELYELDPYEQWIQQILHYLPTLSNDAIRAILVLVRELGRHST